MNTRNVTCNLTRWNSGCNDIYKTDQFEKSLKNWFFANTLKLLERHQFLKVGILVMSVTVAHLRSSRVL